MIVAPTLAKLDQPLCTLRANVIANSQLLNLFQLGITLLLLQLVDKLILMMVRRQLKKNKTTRTTKQKILTGSSFFVALNS